MKRTGLQLPPLEEGPVLQLRLHVYIPIRLLFRGQMVLAIYCIIIIIIIETIICLRRRPLLKLLLLVLHLSDR